MNKLSMTRISRQCQFIYLFIYFSLLQKLRALYHPNAFHPVTLTQHTQQVYDKGMVAAAASIIQKEGPGALLSGLGPTIVGYGVEGAMKFGLYEVGKPVFGALLSSSRKAAGEVADIPPLAFLLASIVAGAIAAMLLCPMESLRIKQVTDEEYANTSLMTGLPKLMQTDGMTALFGGLLAMLAKQVRSRWLLIFHLPCYGDAVHRWTCGTNTANWEQVPYPTKLTLSMLLAPCHTLGMQLLYILSIPIFALS
jgi:hypothetical protein